MDQSPPQSNNGGPPQRPLHQNCELNKLSACLSSFERCLRRFYWSNLHISYCTVIGAAGKIGGPNITYTSWQFYCTEGWELCWPSRIFIARHRTTDLNVEPCSKRRNQPSPMGVGLYVCSMWVLFSWQEGGKCIADLHNWYRHAGAVDSSVRSHFQ